MGKHTYTNLEKHGDMMAFSDSAEQGDTMNSYAASICASSKRIDSYVYVIFLCDFS